MAPKAIVKGCAQFDSACVCLFRKNNEIVFGRKIPNIRKTSAE